MKHVQFTDLPFKTGSDKILLFQPETTVKAGKNLPMGREFLEKTFADAINLTGLIHVCSVCCNSHNDECGGPYALGPECGGRLLVKSAGSLEFLQRRVEPTEVALTCSNPACNMEVMFLECSSKSDLSNLFLHLALKQMVPSLSVGNYLDCGKTEDNYRLRGGQGDAIRALGLIAFASEILWGTVQNGYFGSKSHLCCDHFSLGFMFAPGMQTADGCGGYDQWLKLLVEKKFESLKEAHRSFAPLLLGPKLSRGN